jgi:hypothetical protein
MNNKTLMIFFGVVLFIVLGSLGYLLSSNLLKSDIPTERAITRYEQMSDSTEIVDIEKDVISTDFSDLDKELVDIDKELNSVE